MRASALAGVLLAFAASSASAEVLRTAVIVGSNEGAAGRSPLRFAESDAAKLARVLVELGSFSSDDVYLFRGRAVEDVRRGFGAVARKVSDWRKGRGDARAAFVFFYSGHSDGESLELGKGGLPFTELKQLMAATGADVRVVILDSCNSGALLASKGGRPGAGFDIRLADQLTSRGEALLTSTASDELALESGDLRGSFFSHHLISALRGVGDGNGDGRVTLQEAYQHAYARTLTETSGSIYGPQHAHYDYRISGQGELVLTDLGRPGTIVELPAGFDRVLLATSREVVAELRGGAAQRVAVPAGRYTVRGWRGQEVRQMTLALAAGERRAVSAEELGAGEPLVATTKGGALVGEADALLVSASLGSSLAIRGEGSLAGLRLSAGARAPGGWRLALAALASPAAQGRETQLGAGLGYRWGSSGLLASRRLTLWLAGDLEGGWVGGDQAAGTLFTAAAPGGGLAFALTPTLALALEAQVPLVFLGGAQGFSPRARPRAWLGLAFGF